MMSESHMTSALGTPGLSVIKMPQGSEVKVMDVSYEVEPIPLTPVCKHLQGQNSITLVQDMERALTTGCTCTHTDT